MCVQRKTRNLAKGRVQKKKLVENSTKQGGGSVPNFPLRKKKEYGFKTLDFPKDHFKTHLFFSIFGWGTLLSLDLGPKGVSNL